MLRPAREIVHFRSLLATLTTRELKARYRGSILGYLWSLANPLLLLAVYALVFGFIFEARFEGVEPYPVFLVSGPFPWLWASTSLLEGSLAFTANSGLLRKAVFPVELLPTVSVFSNLAHFLLALPILAGALVACRSLGFPLSGGSALLMPLVVLLQIPMLTGLALGLSALNAHFKDVRDLVQNMLTLTFFMTPILYPLSQLQGYPALWWIVRLNPFTPFTLAYQQTLFHGVVPDPELWLQMVAMSAIAWAIGAWLFSRLRETLVEAA